MYTFFYKIKFNIEIVDKSLYFKWHLRAFNKFECDGSVNRLTVSSKNFLA